MFCGQLSDGKSVVRDCQEVWQRIILFIDGISKLQIYLFTAPPPPEQGIFRAIANF